MGVIIRRGEKSTNVTGGINIISSFTNILERRILNNPFWYLCKEPYFQIFSQKNKKPWQIFCFSDEEDGHI